MNEAKEMVVDALAAQIRSLYIDHRNQHLWAINEREQVTDKLHPRWDGGEPDSRGVQYKAIWPKLARLALKDKLNPTHWVATLFRLAHLFDRVPQPSDLTNKEVLARVGRWKQDYEADMRASLCTEVLNVKRELFFRKRDFGQDELTILGYILSGNNIAISHVVRYVWAYRYKMDKLIAAVETSALAQYMAAPKVYHEAFGRELGRLPELAKLVEEKQGVET